MLSNSKMQVTLRDGMANISEINNLFTHVNITHVELEYFNLGRNAFDIYENSIHLKKDIIFSLYDNKPINGNVTVHFTFTQSVTRIDTATDVYYEDTLETIPNFKQTLSRILLNLPNSFTHLVNHGGVPNTILAGGYLRACIDKTISSDVDLFFENHEDYLNACQFFRGNPDLYYELDEDCFNRKETSTCKFKDKSTLEIVNLVGFNYHKDVVSLLDTFDFDCVTAAVKNGKLTHGKLFWVVADVKILSLRNIINPYRTQHRIEKYLKDYKYSLDNDFMSKFVELAIKKNFSDIWLKYSLDNTVIGEV